MAGLWLRKVKQKAAHLQIFLFHKPRSAAGRGRLSEAFGAGHNHDAYYI